MEDWVDLGVLITPRPGIERRTAWSKARRPNRCATKTLGQGSILNPTQPMGEPNPLWHDCSHFVATLICGYQLDVRNEKRMARQTSHASGNNVYTRKQQTALTHAATNRLLQLQCCYVIRRANSNVNIICTSYSLIGPCWPTKAINRTV